MYVCVCMYVYVCHAQKNSEFPFKKKRRNLLGPKILRRNFPPILQPAELAKCAGEEVQLGRRDGQSEGRGLPRQRHYLGDRVRCCCCWRCVCVVTDGCCKDRFTDSIQVLCFFLLPPFQMRRWVVSHRIGV